VKRVFLVLVIIFNFFVIQCICMKCKARRAYTYALYTVYIVINSF